MSETCLDAIYLGLVSKSDEVLICTLELGHEGPHSNGSDRWISG